MGMGNL